MSFKLGAQSEKNLIGVHPDLVLVVREAIKITDIDFKVIEGCRTLARQKELVKIGASQTMNSRHLTGLISRPATKSNCTTRTFETATVWRV